ncbi:hypothetical protein KA005_80635, partial [bacterium]|nr:hypothetical protein [bacterium]
MPRKFNLDSFLEKCRIIHNDFYNYDLVEYNGCRVKIKISCPIHGIFKQRIDHHLSGSGCKHCRSDKMHTLLSLTQDDFINRAVKVHGNIYNYSVAKYLSSKDKVKIICPTHGLFEQRASNHLNGRGCP